MKGIIALALLIVCSSAVLGEDVAPAVVKDGWIDYVHKAQEYTSLVSGFFTGIFSTAEKAAVASCFATTDKFYDIFYKLHDAIEKKEHWTNYIQIWVELGDVVLVMCDDCSDLVKDFKQLYLDMVKVIENFDKYWLYITENIITEVTDIFLDIAYVKKVWENKEYFKCGEKCGEILYDFLLAKIDDILSIQQFAIPTT
eukprot:TRINITY_DN34277_c0_g1_i1.p1 TRINITY_DN34277_c0_g1~~TRINITY_DN34277_c0_g1_i1.p1  ORF type:complete len:198 (+),score=38.34 TRINITY_DN34277_c0_g1_i1:1-594(+)